MPSTTAPKMPKKYAKKRLRDMTIPGVTNRPAPSYLDTPGAHQQWDQGPS
jgi:hypothetical protein